jgi:hypothetical protein
MRRKVKGISAAGWFYQQSFVSSGYTENGLMTDTPYKAMERLNNAVGYLQTLPEFTAEAQNILADARKRVAAANLRRQELNISPDLVRRGYKGEPK